MKINRQWYEDKVRACWIGKNIGGTMGAPFECKPEMQNISGFSTPKGEPLPNDDLDLQTLWLKAVEERGIINVNTRLLSEYWVRFVPAPWNEYSICKANLRAGILPPLSGEYDNGKWKTSNGAWIRTEIWACLFPGFPNLAVRYAYRDAAVDHGISEGTYAAMFVAALESMAFLENDLRKLFDIGLSYIPEDCMVTKSVRLAIKCYDDGVDFKDARNKIVDFNSELGMFQAPGNVSFVILGLLYGEGDFKKSMINAINCGDDTDCTGATIGSIMAIMGGMKVIPPDWEEYIGDKIVSNAIDLAMSRICRSCSELTERVINVLPLVLGAFDVHVTYTDGENEYDEKPHDLFAQFPIPTNPNTYDDLADLLHTKVRAEFEGVPVITPEKPLKMNLCFLDCLGEARILDVKVHLPHGWSAQYRKSIQIKPAATATPLREHKLEVILSAEENIKGINKIFVEVDTPGHPVSGMIPVVILG